MYKTIFLDHDEYACESQEGNVKCLENLLNEWYENGWDLVPMASAPYMEDSDYYNYVLIFKKRGN